LRITNKINNSGIFKNVLLNLFSPLNKVAMQIDDKSHAGYVSSDKNAIVNEIISIK